jgi:DNA-directed RNA polymerase subunit RPC12/RpoP
MTDEEKNELHKMLPRIPEKFRTWAEKRFDDRRTFFFSRKQNKLHIECAHCGQKFVKEDTPEFEEFRETYTGPYIKCPKCKVIGRLASKRNRKNPICHDIDLWYGQKLPQGGWILRFFRPILSAVPDKEKSYEVFELSERMRYWFPAGMKKKLYKEFYHPWGWHGGEWNSTYCFSTMGYTNNSPTCGFIHPDTWKNMKGTVMQYSMTQEALENDRIARYYTIADWQQAYIKNPWFEMLFKTGLIEIIWRKRYNGLGMRLNPKAKTPWDYLKIEKRRFKDLVQQKPEDQIGALQIYRMEKISGNLGEYAQDLIKYGLPEEDIKKLLSHSSAIKIINYIRKQTKKGNTLAGKVREYRDYLEMKEALGYDMTDSIILFPKNLKAAHDKAVIEKDERAAETRKAEVEERFKEIRTRFKGADKVYHYESGALVIRPAMSASEIVDEGRLLHHCVGGDGYLKSHAERRKIICLLRTKKNPEEPYITVELNPQGKIEQWYGIHDSKPDEKKIDRWLGRYVKSLDLAKLQKEAKSRTKQHKTAV